MFKFITPENCWKQDCFNLIAVYSFLVLFKEILHPECYTKPQKCSGNADDLKYFLPCLFFFFLFKLAFRMVLFCFCSLTACLWKALKARVGHRVTPKVWARTLLNWILPKPESLEKFAADAVQARKLLEETAH